MKYYHPKIQEEIDFLSDGRVHQCQEVQESVDRIIRHCEMACKNNIRRHIDLIKDILE